ncbi:MAG: PP2C family protein-serine/threonine phosphatase [Candidatus Berkiellales bacterium]
MTFNITFYETTNQGKRQKNEDYYAHVIRKNWVCFVVADGLGGHAFGEVASRAIVEALITKADEYSELLSHSKPLEAMASYIRESGRMMRDTILQQCGRVDAETTVALLWLNPNHMITAHVGDSRVYRLNREGMLWRTPDHSMVQELFEEGKITEEDFGKHPLQNRLLKAVNIFETPAADLYLHPPLNKDETILLCTDGFWEYLTQKDLITLANSADVQQFVTEKIKVILAENPKTADNITLQVIRLQN